MRCEYCKAVMPDGAAFCPECGRPQGITKSRIDAAIAGDQAALTDLYNRTYNAVYNTIRFMVKDEDAALDILQDSYIKAFANLEQLQEAARFEPWIKRIAHNKAIDYLRQEKPVTFSSMTGEDPDDVPEFEDDRPENLPEVVIDRKETARLINEILDSLPEEQRVCISLFYYDQLSVKEIAAELGVTEATVKSRLNYGRKKVETQVRALEKKGTKLYGLAPIPLLILLLQGQDLIGRAPSSAVLQNVLAGGSSQAAAAGSAAQMAGEAAESAAEAAVNGAQAAANGIQMTGSTAGAAAAKTAACTAVKHAVVHAAGKALAMKIVAAVAAVAVVTGGTVAAVHHFRNAGSGPDTVITQPADTQEKETLPAPTKTEPATEESQTTRPAPETAPVPTEPETTSAPVLPAEPETTSMPTEPSEAETEPVTESGAENWGNAWIGAYQTVLDGYRDCMAEGLGGTSPYLYYECVRLTLEAWDPSCRLVYGLYDVNGDGTPELVLAMEILLWTGAPSYTEFEVYAFDGTGAVPLCLGLLEEYEVPVIGNNGTIWSTLREGESSSVTFYELPFHGSELVQTMHFDLITYEDTYFELYRPENAVITYYSIQKSVPSTYDSPTAVSMPYTEWIAHVKDQLGIPADLETHNVVDWEHPSYWEASGTWTVRCEFYHGNTLVAYAMVDRTTGDLARDIMTYNGH